MLILCPDRPAVIHQQNFHASTVLPCLSAAAARNIIALRLPALHEACLTSVIHSFDCDIGHCIPVSPCARLTCFPRSLRADVRCEVLPCVGDSFSVCSSSQ